MVRLLLESVIPVGRARDDITEQPDFYDGHNNFNILRSAVRELLDRLNIACLQAGHLRHQLVHWIVCFVAVARRVVACLNDDILM